MHYALACEPLKKIRCMNGADEIKAFAERLVFASNKRSRVLKHFAPPNLLLLANEGAGVTYCLRLLTDLLHQVLPVNAFVGEEDFFEWCIEDEEVSFKRLLIRIRQAGGFYGQFCGLIGLDLRPLLENSNTLPDLRRLLTFVREQQNIVFVFVAPQSMSQSLRKALEVELRTNTIIETLHLPPPDKETAAAYILGQLHRCGFQAESDVCKAVMKAAAQMTESKRFAGFRSLDTVVDEIVWRKAAQGEKTPLLRVQDFDGLVWTNQTDNMQKNSGYQRKIGFGQNR